MLVDDPKSLVIYGENERLSNLAQGLQRGQRYRKLAGNLRLVLESRGTTMVGNQFRSAGKRDRSVCFHRDSSLELKALIHRNRCGRVEAEASSRRLERGWPRCGGIDVRTGAQQRTGGRVRMNFRNELRHRARFHQHGADGIANEVVQQRLLPESD